MTITLRQTTAAGATRKDSTLTYAELDENFVHLLNNKIRPLQVNADTGVVTVGEAQSNGVFTITGGADITTAVTEDSAGNANLEIAFSGSVGIADIVEDTSPQLGGALDANSNNITNLGTLNTHTVPGGTGTIALTSDITFTEISQDTTPQLGGTLDAQSNNFTNVGTLNTHTIPGGTGTIALTSDIPADSDTTYNISAETVTGGANLRLTDSTAGTDDVKLAEGTGITVTRTDANTITLASTITSGISNLSEDTSPQLGGSLDVNSNAIVSTSNQNINLNPDGSGKVQINNAYTLPNADGTNGQVLTTNGTGTLSFSTVAGGSSTLDGLSDVTITSAADNQYLRYDNGTSQWINETVTGVTNLNDLSDVSASGPTNGQLLQYNDSASAWQTVTLSFLSNISEDTSPQLGGALDAQSNNFTSVGTINTHTIPGGTGTIALTSDIPSAGISNVVEDTTPQLGGTLDCQDNIVQSPDLKDYKETVHSLGSTDNPSISVSNGNVQTVTISSALNLPAFNSPATGQSVTLIVSGSGTASGTGAYKFAGGNKTLTNDSVVSIFYDGTTYFTSIATDFQS